MQEPTRPRPPTGQHAKAQPQDPASQGPRNLAPRPRGHISQKLTIQARNSSNPKGTSGFPHSAGGDTDNAGKLVAAHVDSNYVPNPGAQPHRGLRTTSQGPGDS